MQYSIQALWTAAQLRARIVVVVAVNETYGILKSFADFENTPGVPGLDIPGIDIAGLAAAYGCASATAATARRGRGTHQNRARIRRTDGHYGKDRPERRRAFLARRRTRISLLLKLLVNVVFKGLLDFRAAERKPVRAINRLGECRTAE